MATDAPAASIDLGLDTITAQVEPGGVLTLHVTGQPGWGCTVNPTVLAEFANQLTAVAREAMAHPNYRGPRPAEAPGSTWRVVYVRRPGIDAPDDDAGCADFESEAGARAYFTSDEVTSRMGAYWRAELRVRPPWRVVEAHQYRSDEQVKP